jgi:hypothetical protein
MMDPGINDLLVPTATGGKGGVRQDEEDDTADNTVKVKHREVADCCRHRLSLRQVIYME